jgi:RHS repeat-associated protein
VAAVVSLRRSVERSGLASSTNSRGAYCQIGLAGGFNEREPVHGLDSTILRHRRWERQQEALSFRSPYVRVASRGGEVKIKSFRRVAQLIVIAAALAAMLALPSTALGDENSQLFNAEQAGGVLNAPVTEDLEIMTGEGLISCPSVGLNGSFQVIAEALVMQPAASVSCDYPYTETPVQMATNGCKLRFNAPTDVENEGTLDVFGCEKGFTVSFSLCYFTLPPQEGIGPVYYESTGSGSSRKVKIDLEASNLTYFFSKAGCSAQGSNGKIEGGWNASRVSNGGQTGLWLESPPLPPAGMTGVATEIRSEAATLNGAANPRGLATTYKFEYGTTTEYGQSAPVSPQSIGSGTKTASVDEPIAGLSFNTTYHYRLVATNSLGTFYGENGSFKTAQLFTAEEVPIAPAAVFTEDLVMSGLQAQSGEKFTIACPKWEFSSTEATQSAGAWLEMQPIHTGLCEIKELGLEAEPAMNGCKFRLNAPTSVKGQGTMSIVGCTEGITIKFPGCHFKLPAQSGIGPVYYENIDPGSKRETAADLDATGVQYSFTKGLFCGVTTTQSNGVFGGGWDASALNAAKKQVGLWLDFPPPDATTEAATNVQVSQADLNATVNPEDKATSYYFEYGKTTSYGSSIPVSAKSIGSGAVGIEVSQTPTGLEPDTTYHYRVVAESAAGTAYGTDASFTTKPQEFAFAAESTPITLGGTSLEEFKLFTESGWVSCAGWPLVGTEQEAGGALNLQGPTYAKCQFSGLEYNLYDHGCEFRFHPGAEVQSEPLRTEGTMDIVNCEEPMGFTGTCTLEVSDQIGIGPVAFETTGSGTGRKVIATLEGSGVEYTFDGCGSEESQDDGFLTGAWNMSAYDGNGNPVGLWLEPAPAPIMPAYDSTFAEEGSGEGELSEPKGSAAVDAQGNVFLADSGSDRVQKFNDRGEYVSQLSEADTQPLSDPRGVAVDAGGNLFVLDTGNDRIVKYDAEGQFAAVIGSSGSGEGQLSEPTGIAIDAEGSIWVVDSGNDRVVRFDYKGQYVGQFGAQGSGKGKFEQPLGIALDNAGSVWVTDCGNDRVQRFDTEGKYLGKFGYEGSADGALSCPAAIAADGDGDLWVADSGNDRIEAFNPEGEFLGKFGITGEGNEQFDGPSGVASNAEGHLWVTDAGNGRLTEWSPPSPDVQTDEAISLQETKVTLNATINPRGRATTYYFEYTTVETFQEEGWAAAERIPFKSKSIGAGSSNVKVSRVLEGLDAGTNYHFRAVGENAAGVSRGENATFSTATDSRYSGAFGEEGAGDGELNEPTGIVVDASGNAFVADTGNDRVEKFDAEGDYDSQLTEAGELALSGPRDVALSVAGNLWVADTGNDRVVKYDPEGEFEIHLGSSGSGEGQFDEPTGIAIDTQGHLWVVDSGNDRIQEFNSRGTYIRQFGTPGSGNGQFEQPLGITVDNAGSVWVTDCGNARVQKFDAEGKYLSKFGYEGSLPCPTAIDIDAEGMLWIADTGHDRVKGFTSLGEYRNELGSPGSADGQLQSPNGVAVNAEGKIWVTDTGNDRIQVWDFDHYRPQTTITSPTPTYTGGTTPQIEFTANEPNSTFKCSFNSYTTWSPCQSPYVLPKNLSRKQWHNFSVQATDAAGNKESWPAKWTFSLKHYPAAPSTSKLALPEEGKKTSQYFTLKAEWDSSPYITAVTGATFQLKLDGWEEFKTIPTEYVLGAGGEPVSWPVTAASKTEHTEPVYFDYLAAAKAEGWSLQEKEMKLRAIIDGEGDAGMTDPTSVEFNSVLGAPSDATASVGPTTLDLLTGQHTITRTDVSIPVPGSPSNLEFTRVYNSAYEANEKTNSKVLSPMWQPSAPVEAEYPAEAWQKAVVQHQPAVEAVYDRECWNEEGEQVSCGAGCPPESCEEWLVEPAIPEANWVEVLDNEGAGIPFDKVGESYIAPEEAKEYKLTKPGVNFILTESNGTRTTFTQSGETNEYKPSRVSFQGAPTEARMVYEVNESKRRLKMIIGPSAAGVTCNDVSEEANYAPETEGCRTLEFSYAPISHWAGSSSEERLESITYYNASGDYKDSDQVVAQYAYSSDGWLLEEWDPRIPSGLLEKYAYSTQYEGGPKLASLTPPGEEPWELAYYDEGANEGKLKSVSRASLVESPATATTTIVYDVPIGGEGAPYNMSPSTLAEWGQTDHPVNATAIFPPDQIPDDPPEDYSHAVVHYLDPDGHKVNTASPAPPGVSGDVISTSETSTKGNVVRSLSPQNRLLALSDEYSVARSKELDSHSTYSADGTKMLESWGPLHEVRLESGETVEARAHTTVEYDSGFEQTAEEKAADAPFPNLPTKETTGAAIPGKGADADVSVAETKYNWTLRKPVEQITDPEGLNLRTKIVYDSSTGQVTEERQPSDAEGTYTAGTTMTVYYSADANVEPSSCGNKAAWAGLPCVTYPAADPSPAESNPKLPWTWYLTYNSLDEPTETQEKTNGVLKRTTTVSYDSVGRPVKTKTTGSEGTSLPSMETIYNSSTGAIEKQKLVCEAPESCTGFDTQQLTTTYDELGRLTEYEDADGGKSEVAYDFMSRPVITSDGKGTQTLTYDEDSGVATKLEDSAAGTFLAAYDANGQVTEQVLPNGLAQQITYDEEGTPTSLKYQKVSGCESGCTWLEFNRQLSIAGQVLKETGTLATKEYTYDKIGRLTLAKETPAGEGCTTRAYAFEGTAGKNSNRTAKTVRAPKEGGACDTTSAGTKTSYSYDTADRLIGEGTTYDSLGRITSLPSKYSGGGTLTSSYYVNDLTRSQTQDGLTNTYYLDAGLRQRERVQSGSKSSTEVYHYSGGSDSPSWTQEGANWTRNVSAMGGALGALQKSSGEITFQLADMHGDVVGIAESNPSATKLKSTLAFDEFGNPKQGSTPKFGWLGANGRRTELPSGVIQMGMRSYVPALGRFLTMDPIKGGSANAYDYANQDPVNTFDLTGECAHRKKSCQRKEAKKLKARAHRKAKNHRMRRLAAASRNRGGGARASFVPPLPGDLFGADMREKVGGAAAGVAVAAASAALERLKQGAIISAATAIKQVMDYLELADEIGYWVRAHREQVYGCVSGAIEGAMESSWILGFGPKGAAAMGLFVAVSCGAGWLTSG